MVHFVIRFFISTHSQSDVLVSYGTVLFHFLLLQESPSVGMLFVIPLKNQTTMTATERAESKEARRQQKKGRNARRTSGSSEQSGRRPDESPGETLSLDDQKQRHRLEEDHHVMTTYVMIWIVQTRLD